MKNAAFKWFDGIDVKAPFVTIKFKKPSGWSNTSTKGSVKVKN